ncbi:MAG TPA: type II secretion system F family protein [Tepidisphaeraceae bacterium]|nr:type II secretion system F family protein [Tepidisphaeraceae bacterium]
MSPAIVLIFLVFGMVAALGYWLTLVFTAGMGGTRIRDRLELDSPAIAAAMRPSFDLRTTLQRIGASFAKPFMPDDRKKESALRRSMAMAGIYNPNAIRLLAGCKLILLCTGLAFGYSFGSMSDQLLFGLSTGGMLGYMAPVIWLRWRIKKHQANLTYSLPDALDLLVVCVEAGLTIDASIQRVGQELALAHGELSRELFITHMETRVGVSRTEALKSLASRTQNQSIQSLVAMLVQADRFGTSIAQSLRIHSESLRSKRQHQAEERAARASVKMTFPLVLFIFPSTFIALAGPAVLHMMASSFFK